MRSGARRRALRGEVRSEDLKEFEERVKGVERHRGGEERGKETGEERGKERGGKER